MKNAALGVLVFCGLGLSQTVVSKLNGKRIYMHRQDAGHQDGYNGMTTLLQSNAAKYGYTFEYSVSPLNETALNAVFNRLYKPGVPNASNTIDILIFCQGEGDRNAAGNPFPNTTVRFGQINAHVKSGGVLISVHGAHGREVSWQNWTFGANLMTDWFVDNYYAATSVPGNGGHFGANTAGTMTLDAETLPANDSSTYFIRRILTNPANQGGYAQPLVTNQVRGEWYHFNGGKQYENGTGNNVSHANNKVQPKPVRGNPGIPDTGIGPAKIVAILTNIQGANYTPPAPGRHSVWVREVSLGAFNAGNPTSNGRFVAFNPGHLGNEYSNANGYIGDLFLSTLRWAVKDDRGCKNPAASNYNALATVGDGTCAPVSIGRNGLLRDGNSAVIGNISADHSGIAVSLIREAPHFLQIASVNGKRVFQQRGIGMQQYRIPGLESGLYVVRVDLGGEVHHKMVSIR
jgi:hypothetical protein